MPAPSPHEPVPPVPLSTALRYWLKLGFISFGGPAGQIGLMHDELVERRRWISENRFLHALNYTMLLPGPEAQQLATYLGWLLHGFWGGLAAGLLFVLPSFFLLMLLTGIYLTWGNLPAVEGFLYGLKPAVIALVGAAAYRLGTRVLTSTFLKALAFGAFVGLFFFAVPFPFLIFTAGVLGFLGARLLPEQFQRPPVPPGAASHATPAWIDDTTPIPEALQFQPKRFLRWTLIGLSLWGGSLGILLGIYGSEHPFAQMGWFFSKAALMTFGGAYAVLPYVQQGGVEAYGWLSTAQMMDGLALGETTPGPLIMIVTFVGFVGGWTQAALGPEWLLLAGVAGASVATFFTFLPSFLLILLGGPFVESTRQDLQLRGPLTGITAAVVGVMVNLAVFFSYHVFWPEGFAGDVEGPSLILGLLAFLALYRFQTGVVPVLSGCALAGFGLQLWSGAL